MPSMDYEIKFEGTPAEIDLYQAVASLSVDEGTSAPSQLQLVLSPELRADGSWAYLGDPRLNPFRRVSVSLGFVGTDANRGTLVPVFDGYVTSTTLVMGSAPGSTRFEVSAMDASVLMSVDEKVAAFADMSDSDAVTQILANYPVSPRVTATSTVHQSHETTLVQRGTDIQFVRTLARRNGFEFYVQPSPTGGASVAHFAPPALSGSPQGVLAIQFADESNLASFTARLTSQRPLKVKTQQLDVHKPEPKEAVASSSQLESLGSKRFSSLVGGQLGQLLSSKGTLGQMLVLGPPTSDASELQTIAQAVRDEAEWFVTASAEVNADAYGAVLRPAKKVLIKGAGNQYSGAYYVTSVVHEVRTDGTYRQRFEARRNGRDLDGSEVFA